MYLQINNCKLNDNQVFTIFQKNKCVILWSKNLSVTGECGEICRQRKNGAKQHVE